MERFLDMLPILMSGEGLSPAFCGFTAISYKQMGQLPCSHLTSRAYIESITNELQGSRIMLKWALIFALLAIVASIMGFSGIAAGAAGISKFLLLLVVIGVLIVIGVAVLGYRARRK